MNALGRKILAAYDKRPSIGAILVAIAKIKKRMYTPALDGDDLRDVLREIELRSRAEQEKRLANSLNNEHELKEV